MGFRSLFVAATTFFTAASTAVASVPVDHVYGGAAGSVQSDLERGGGTLPFTGTDLALLVIGGLTLLIAGVVLRRTVRHGA